MCADAFLSAPSFSMFCSVYWTPNVDLLSSPYRPEHQEPMDTQFSRQRQDSNLGFQRGYVAEEDFPPLHTDKPGGASATQRGRSRSKGNRSRSGGRSASMARSISRTSSVRITTPGADKGPWATKAKKTSQPQLKAEIAEIKGAKMVNAAPPSRPNRPVENIGESPIAEVPMDTHSEVRPAKRKATTEHMRNEELDFQVQTTDSLAEIKETLKQMTEAMASLGARTSKLEEELCKPSAKKGVKSLVKSRATSLGGDPW
ncbi:hypothetical protein MRX96_028308 [Rhipicephalus microplus]